MQQKRAQLPVLLHSATRKQIQDEDEGLGIIALSRSGILILLAVLRPYRLLLGNVRRPRIVALSITW